MPSILTNFHLTYIRNPTDQVITRDPKPTMMLASKVVLGLFALGAAVANPLCGATAEVNTNAMAATDDGGLSEAAPAGEVGPCVRSQILGPWSPCEDAGSGGAWTSSRIRVSYRGLAYFKIPPSNQLSVFGRI